MNTDNDSQIKEISSPDGARRGQPGRIIQIREQQWYNNEEKNHWQNQNISL